jgi:hypothetical protein
VASAPNDAVVQCAGLGFRLPTTTAVRAFEERGPLTSPLLRYTQALMTQIAQTAACNRHHSLDQRLLPGKSAPSS